MQKYQRLIMEANDSIMKGHPSIHNAAISADSDKSTTKRHESNVGIV